MIKAPRGTKDVLPGESYRWHYIEGVIRQLCDRYGFREMRTPVFESTELFLRGVGDTTDIVQKEMYTFKDKGDRSISLRPEGTAGFARAFIEHGMHNDPQPTKLYYLPLSVFRYENPQAGRLRQHHQFGVEMFGAAAPSADAEVISLAWELFAALGVGNLMVNLNSIGCPNCRPNYQKKLTEFLGDNLEKLCPTCAQRFSKNPLRILDCKDENCQALIANAPVVLDCLCQECADHFATLQSYLTALDIPFAVNPMIVRGLDYYTKTVFEIISSGIGAQGTVCGGGRYDGLIQELGGPALPGVGFGLGLERLLLVLEANGVELPDPGITDVLLMPMGDAAKSACVQLVYRLRRAGVRADTDHVGRGLKAQFKYADKLGAKVAVVLGEDELKSGNVKVKDLAAREETPVALDSLIDYLAGLLA